MLSKWTKVSLSLNKARGLIESQGQRSKTPRLNTFLKRRGRLHYLSRGTTGLAALSSPAVRPLGTHSSAWYTWIDLYVWIYTVEKVC